MISKKHRFLKSCRFDIKQRKDMTFWKFKKKNKTVQLSYIMGEYSYHAADFIAPGTVIGKYCSIGAGVRIGADYHPTNYISTSPKLYQQDYKNGKLVHFPHIEIGNDVWIGWNVLILKSCKIGTGAVIGAGSVVTHDVPPYAVVAGNPARIIRYRYSESDIAKLLESEWWNYPHENLLTLDFSVKPEVFLQELEKIKK